MPADRQNVVLVYPVSVDRKQILMQFHKDPEDPSYNRYNGISAWPRQYESLAEAGHRALRSAGVAGAQLNFRGSVHWSRFAHNDWPLFGYHFLARLPQDVGIVMEDDQVRRRWINVEDLFSEQVPCWPGDMYILPLVLDDQPKPFHGLMIYDNGVPKEWRHERA